MSDQEKNDESADASANAGGEAPEDKGRQPSGTTPEADSAKNQNATYASAAEYFPNGLKVDTGQGGSVDIKYGNDPVLDSVLNTMHKHDLNEVQVREITTSFIQAAHKHDPKPPTEEEMSASSIFNGDGPQHIAASKRTREELLARGILSQQGLEELEDIGGLNKPGLVRFFSELGVALNESGGPSPSAVNRVPPAQRKTRGQMKENYRVELMKAGGNRDAVKRANKKYQDELTANAAVKVRD